MTRILLTVALAVYNNVASLWPPFNRTAYVPANLLAAGAVLVTGTEVLGLSSEQLGLADVTLADAALGAGIGAAVAGPLLVLGRTARGARLVADRRASDLRGRALAYQTLIRVPLGTALLEEVAFRGVLFAAWLGEGEAVAYVVSSAVFGLWHVAPAAAMVRLNAPGATATLTARSILGTVVVTSVAGAALTWLRVETGSLAAPFSLHATLNSVATLAGRRLGRR